MSDAFEGLIANGFNPLFAPGYNKKKDVINGEYTLFVDEEEYPKTINYISNYKEKLLNIYDLII